MQSEESSDFDISGNDSDKRNYLKDEHKIEVAIEELWIKFELRCKRCLLWYSVTQLLLEIVIVASGIFEWP